MSVQFGRWNFDGRPIDLAYLNKVNSLLSAYAPDGENWHREGSIAICHHAFHTTEESRSEAQPCTLPSGAILTWDGRMDNREELIQELGRGLSSDSSDSRIFGAAYERWGVDCLPKLIGDWAIAIWDSRKRLLLLARDFAGIRPLFYAFSETGITWSSTLDPLVLLAGKRFKLSEEYLAGWLFTYPATNLTPYADIHAVPPCSIVSFKDGSAVTRKYWEFDPAKRIHLASDHDYEEQFRGALRIAVERRLRSSGRILMELSGGMDSSSIVCMADTIGRTPSLSRPETVSFYDNSEPNWNEQPFFTVVEQARKHTGHHIAIHPQQLFQVHSERTRFQPTPGSTVGCHTEAIRKLASLLRSENIRVVLSGIGGDEVTGGVPTPMPELQDFLVTGHVRQFARSLRLWALTQRRPWTYLLWEAVCGFLPTELRGISAWNGSPWLRESFVSRNRVCLARRQRPVQLFGPLPSFQANLQALDGLCRQLACDGLCSDPPVEKRYPYLDRTLLEFLFAIPREQIVRPGQRRSLMRRSLAGIVPREILERRRKAFVSRGSRVALGAEWPYLIAWKQGMFSSAFDIVDRDCFVETLARARTNAEVPLVRLMRVLFLELWLKNLHEHHVGLEQPSRLTVQGESCEEPAFSA